MTPAPAQSVVPLSLVRRILRVRERFSMQPEHVDEVFDDFFVLWRAFESTIDGTDRRAARAEDAVVETVAYARRSAQARGKHFGAVAPRIIALCRELRLFQRAHDGQLALWFSEEEITTVQGQEIRTRLARLTSAAQTPDRWHDRDSRDAGWTLYRLRCAVFHASVETSDSLALRIAPLVCAALIELGALRAAFLSRGELSEAWQLVGGPDDL